VRSFKRFCEIWRTYLAGPPVLSDYYDEPGVVYAKSWNRCVDDRNRYEAARDAVWCFIAGGCIAILANVVGTALL